MSWTVHQADVSVFLKDQPPATFDGCLTDPPYGLRFMGKAWDHGVPSAEVWAEVLRVLKPGAFCLAFGGTRTFHRLTCAIEDAGFEIRDCAMWLYGSGFPKSMDISKALDKAAGAERPRLEPQRRLNASSSIAPNGFGADGWAPQTKDAQTKDAQTWNGYGTALKPAWEPCLVAMKPCDGTFAENALRHGVAGLNIEAGRIESGAEYHALKVTQGGDHFSIGSGEKTRGTVFSPAAGRWPANLILDPEAGAMLDAQAGDRSIGRFPAARGTSFFGTSIQGETHCARTTDSGGASRFFYCAKASRAERDAGTEGNPHPCLKPLDLCRYLASLILPPKRDTPRRLLVPFAGSGSEMIGGLMAGWDEAVGIELEAEYCEIAGARLRFHGDAGFDAGLFDGDCV